jgi:hypothetical protein
MMTGVLVVFGGLVDDGCLGGVGLQPHQPPRHVDGVHVAMYKV